MRTKSGFSASSAKFAIFKPKCPFFPANPPQISNPLRHSKIYLYRLCGTTQKYSIFKRNIISILLGQRLLASGITVCVPSAPVRIGDAQMVDTMNTSMQRSDLARSYRLWSFLLSFLLSFFCLSVFRLPLSCLSVVACRSFAYRFFARVSLLVTFIRVSFFGCRASLVVNSKVRGWSWTAPATSPPPQTASNGPQVMA